MAEAKQQLQVSFRRKLEAATKALAIQKLQTFRQTARTGA